tara:strand:+ start:378 stop:551 length:174 start_codon:yes stop_codon:yes gene_type:complete
VEWRGGLDLTAGANLLEFTTGEQIRKKGNYNEPKLTVVALVRGGVVGSYPTPSPYFS